MNGDRLPPVTAHRRPGWPLLAVLGAGVVLVAVAFFVVSNPFSGDAGDGSTRYVEAVVGAPSRVNPLFVHLSEADRDVASLVFSGLVRIDKDGTPVPDLAQSWTTNAEGTEVTFALRNGVTWHSGVPFTADDVIFTYGMLANPELQGDPEQASLWQSVSCTAANPSTVTCNLPEPYAPFLAYAAVGILPKHLLEAATPQSIVDDPFNTAPIGTGPYRLASMDSARAVLEAYPAFYGGPPAIDELELAFYPDTASAAASLVGGDVEGLLVDLTINPDDFETLQALDSLRQYPAHRSAHTDLFLNNTEPPFNESAVRQAVSRAVDVDSIVTGLLGGRGVRADTPIIPGSWAFDEDIGGYSHDIGEARSILDEAGWVLEGEETVRKKNGTELRITLMTDQDALRGAVADQIAQQLAEAGIDVAVVQQSPADLVKNYLIPRQYQAAIFGLDSGPDPDPYPAWHSSQALEEGRNLAGYKSDDADALMEEARRTFDMDKRRELYGQFQQRFLDDTPSVPLYAQMYTYFVSSRIEGVDPGILFWPASRYRNAAQWSAATQKAIGG
jgi:peptide/nickel transport system substrate-binding protein